MKKLFIIGIIILMMSVIASAQQTWSKSTAGVALYSASDKIGIGIAPGSDKVTVKSQSGETALTLVGYGTMMNPHFKITGPTGSAVFRLYAKQGWWVIGNAFDSTNSILSVKPDKGWMRFNGTGYFAKSISATSVITTGTVRHSTTDTSVINKFIKLTPVAQPGAAFGNLYLSTADSCLYYYNGAAWKKLAVQ